MQERLRQVEEAKAEQERLAQQQARQAYIDRQTKATELFKSTQENAELHRERLKLEAQQEELQERLKQQVEAKAEQERLQLQGVAALQERLRQVEEAKAEQERRASEREWLLQAEAQAKAELASQQKAQNEALQQAKAEQERLEGELLKRTEELHKADAEQQRIEREHLEQEVALQERLDQVEEAKAKQERLARQAHRDKQQQARQADRDKQQQARQAYIDRQTQATKLLKSTQENAELQKKLQDEQEASKRSVAAEVEEINRMQRKLRLHGENHRKGLRSLTKALTQSGHFCLFKIGEQLLALQVREILKIIRRVNSDLVTDVCGDFCGRELNGDISQFSREQTRQFLERYKSRQYEILFAVDKFSIYRRTLIERLQSHATA